jgi:hypothetical protein
MSGVNTWPYVGFALKRMKMPFMGQVCPDPKITIRKNKQSKELYFFETKFSCHKAEKSKKKTEERKLGS